MSGPGANSTAVVTPTRGALSGFALVAILLLVLVGTGTGIDRAGAAAELKPCESTNPSGPIINRDGALTLAPVRATRKAWKRAGIRQKLIKPANNLTGRPAFPVRAARFTKTARVDLRGGLRISHKRRSVSARKLRVITAPGKPAWLKATVGQARINLFRVKRGRRTFDRRAGEVSKVGYAKLTARGARVLNNRLRVPRKTKLKPGSTWGYFNLYALYKVTKVEDPTGETPEVAPVKAEPAGTRPIQSAATIKWFVRDSWIEYVNSGKGTRVEDGATNDPPSGSLGLVYSFNFPFASGWTVPGTGEDPENTLIKGSGLVGFRYCQNTINFTASDPEIEIDGDTNSRLIFRVNGTDGTAFPDQRAVMVKLLPSQADSHTKVENGDWTTVTYEKIPGFVPAEGTGIFANYYPPFSPEFEGRDPRPDRFGFFSVSYTYSTDP